MVFVVALIVLVALAVIVHRTGPARSRMQPAPIRIPIRKDDQRIPPNER
jgi:hypothetical protein